MTGREQFNRYKGIINILVRAMSLLPKGMLKIIWAMVDNFSGKIALLIRYCILRNITQSCGENIFIGQNVEIKNPENLRLGNNVSIHRGCYIDAAGKIFIGNDVSIAHQSSLISFNHTWDDRSKPIKYNDVQKSKIVVEDDVWIGCGCRILAGVYVHSRSVIAAGAVVNKDVDINTLVGGVPAKQIRTI